MAMMRLHGVQMFRAGFKVGNLKYYGEFWQCWKRWCFVTRVVDASWTAGAFSRDLVSSRHALEQIRDGDCLAIYVFEGC